MVLTISRKDGKAIEPSSVSLFRDIYGNENVEYTNGSIVFSNLQLIDNLNLVTKFRRLKKYKIEVQ